MLAYRFIIDTNTLHTSLPPSADPQHLHASMRLYRLASLLLGLPRTAESKHAAGSLNLRTHSHYIPPRPSPFHMRSLVTRPPRWMSSNVGRPMTVPSSKMCCRARVCYLIPPSFLLSHGHAGFSCSRLYLHGSAMSAARPISCWTQSIWQAALNASD